VTTETRTRRQRILDALPLLGILLLATLLRCYRLDAQSLWNDEGTSVQLALRSLPAIARDAAADIHPPLYYYLLHFWVRLLGTSERAVRSLSALLGIVTVGLTSGLCRPLGKRTALLAALLAAISPLCVYFGQETRMYMLLACLAVACTWALANMTRNRQARWSARLLYWALSAALIYTHYLGWAVLLAHNLAWLVNWITRREQTPIGRWHSLICWAFLQATILLAYLPWLLTSWSSLSGWPAVRDPLPLRELLGEALQVLPFGVTMPFSRGTLLAGAAMAMLAAAALLPSSDTDSRACPERRAALWRLTLATIVPIALIYVLSLSRPMYKTKFLIVCAPFYAALLAQGLITLHTRFSARGKRRWLPNLLGALLLLLPLGASAVSLDHLYYDPTYSRDDYRGIVAYIQATADPDAPILINAPSQVETVSYYHHGPQPLVPLPLRRPLDPAQTEGALARLLTDNERIYAIYWATDESDPNGFIESWLAARCYKAMDSWFGNLRLVVYAVPAARSEDDRIPLGITYGEGIRLDSYSLLTPATESGGILQLGLTWEALAEIPRRYKVFVHLLDERGAIVSQRDSEPLGGQRPTTSWSVGEVVEDAYGLWVRPGTPPGGHRLHVGLYDPESGARLVVTSSESAPIDTGLDAIDLGTVTIASPGTPPPIKALDMARTDGLDWTGLTLLGHTLHRLGFAHAPETPVHPGDLVELLLFWQRTEGSPPEAYRLSLSQGREEVWSQRYAILGERYSPWGWAMGETIREVQTLGLPRDIPPGRYDLLIEPLSSNASADRLQRLTISPQQ